MNVLPSTRMFSLPNARFRSHRRAEELQSRAPADVHAAGADLLESVAAPVTLRLPPWSARRGTLARRCGAMTEQVAFDHPSWQPTMSIAEPPVPNAQPCSFYRNPQHPTV